VFNVNVADMVDGAGSLLVNGGSGAGAGVGAADEDTKVAKQPTNSDDNSMARTMTRITGDSGPR
jgi:hypothetical protein